MRCHMLITAGFRRRATLMAVTPRPKAASKDTTDVRFLFQIHWNPFILFTASSRSRDKVSLCLSLRFIPGIS